MQELLVAEKGALEVRLATSEAALQQHQQQLSELTQKHTAVQAELADSLDYQHQIETQLNELEMEAQAAKASYDAEQAQRSKLTQQLSATQNDHARLDNELTHTKTALDQTSNLNRELQVLPDLPTLNCLCDGHGLVPDNTCGSISASVMHL